MSEPSSEQATAQALSGRVIAIPETRQLDVLAGLLQRRGATVLQCPLVSIHDTHNVEQVHAWLDTCIRDPFDDLILLTGEGLRRLADFAERYGWLEAFVASLQKTRTIVRGPKPAKALRELGLRASLSAAAPTTEGVIETLRGESMYDRRVGVQLYGQEPNLPLQAYLDQAGAHDFFVAPYRYADEAEDQQVVALIDQIIAGQLDAICFTSTPQIKRLLSVAKTHNQLEALTQAMASIVVASIGPIVSQALQDVGLRADIMPSESFFMKPLVQALVDHWA